VLAQLATEDPDLSGLPGELTDLITACLDRVPRARPTASAMLTHLGPFTQAGGLAVEHTYLPEPAMALIVEYQRSPQQAALAQADEERSLDDTSRSLPRLPAEAAFDPPARRRPEPAGPVSPADRGEQRRARVLKAFSRRKES
jgi:hypothetical protein